MSTNQNIIEAAPQAAKTILWPAKTSDGGRPAHPSTLDHQSSQVHAQPVVRTEDDSSNEERKDAKDFLLEADSSNTKDMKRQKKPKKSRRILVLDDTSNIPTETQDGERLHTGDDAGVEEEPRQAASEDDIDEDDEDGVCEKLAGTKITTLRAKGLVGAYSPRKQPSEVTYIEPKVQDRNPRVRKYVR